MPKLLIFSRRFYPDIYSGTETFIHNIFLQLRPHYETRLVCGWYNSPASFPAECRAIRLSGLPKEIGYWKLAHFAKKEIANFRPDLILSNSIEIPEVGRYPTAVIFYDVNFGAISKNLLVRLKEYYYKRKCASANKIIAISHTSANRLEQLGVPRDKIQVVYSGIDFAKYKPAFGPNLKNKTILCYPSRIVPGKGQHIAIQALRQLPPDLLSGIELQIVGRLQDKSYYQELLQDAAGLPVQFYTDVPDVTPFYQTADLIVFPTLLEEGFGYTAVEAMACGKSVVYSDDQAVMEATGGHGFAFPKGNVQALAEIITKLLRDPGRHSSEALKGHQWVSSRYSWEKTGEAYRAILNSMIA